MLRKHDSTIGHAGLVTILLLALGVVPRNALGWAGTPHLAVGEDIGQSFHPESLRNVVHERGGRVLEYPFIERTPYVLNFAPIPEMDLIVGDEFEGESPDEVGFEPGYKVWEVIKFNTMTEDSYDLVTNWPDYGEAPGEVWVDNTVSHFWDADPSILNSVYGLADTYPNAWKKAKILWYSAVAYWQAGDKRLAYKYLAHVLHLVMDQGIPCHAHDDWHAFGDLGGDPRFGDDDALEDYMYSDDPVRRRYMYSWGAFDRTVPADGVPESPPRGGLMVPLNTDDVIAVLANAGEWSDDDELFIPSGVGLQQLFYLMYAVNQYGDFSPSDGDILYSRDGDSFDILSWANYNDGIIAWTNSLGEPLTDADSGSTIAVNDYNDDDAHGNFTLILDVGWRAAWRALPAVVDLFRKTVDNAPPVSDFVVTRADGKDVVEWNNSIVTVRITPATIDQARTDAGMPASGVWKLWGEVDGYARPTDAADGSVFWAIDQDGEHGVRLMSTDWVGNVEGPDRDFVVRVDLTPPEIAFSDLLRPSYLTSESFVPLWTATDATSGVAEEIGYLDGQLVTKGVPIDLALRAGRHSLDVYATDLAGNVRHEAFAFEVWIDTATFALPVVVNSKSAGEGLLVYVEFPAPYDVGAIDVATCWLRPGGAIDLTQPLPVVGGSASVRGERLGGVADRDKDGLPERLIRFDRAAFLAAFGGVTGDVPAVVWGGLEPGGTPRFLGVVTVPVVTPPR